MELLKGKTAIITGASRGIGRATAEIFAEHGSNLFLIARQADPLKKIKTELEQKYDTDIRVYGVDISDYEQLKDFFNEVRSTKLRIDIIVNNAGIMEESVLQMARQDLIERTYKTNVFGMINTTQLGSKLMVRNRAGSIINLTSILGIKGNRGNSIYSSSKSAAIGFTRSMSKELAPYNIRVNAVAPGFIDTDMTRSMEKDQYQKTLDSIGLKRVGRPKDVAGLNLFLASDLSEYITGQIIGVDGGMLV